MIQIENSHLSKQNKGETSIFDNFQMIYLIICNDLILYLYLDST